MAAKGIYVVIIVAVLATCALLAPLGAAAQVPDPYARELARQLSQVDQSVSAQNYQRAAGPFPGGIHQGGAVTFTVTLRAGQEYRVVGVCDTHCEDLDLRLRDPRGGILGEDVLPDDVPVVTVRPTFTGAHTIEVFMAQCGAARCWFAFNVYSR